MQYSDRNRTSFTGAAFSPAEMAALVTRVRERLHLVRAETGHVGVALDAGDHEPIGILPPLYPEWLGDPAFLAAHGARFPYVAGEMATGIATSRRLAAVTSPSVPSAPTRSWRRS